MTHNQQYIFADDIDDLMVIVERLLHKGFTFEAGMHNGRWRIHLTGGY